MTEEHNKFVCDDGEQAIRVVGGGYSDEDYKRNGGTCCPYCRAEGTCYHDEFYTSEEIPVKDDVELHASTCDTCRRAWYDVIDSETGMLLGTRSTNFSGRRLPEGEDVNQAISG